MFARALLFAIALPFVCVQPAAAQKLEPVAMETSPEAAAAGRDFFQAFVVDNGLITRVFDAIGGSTMPSIRDSMLQSPVYTAASPRNQESLRAFMDTLPALVQAELMTEIDVVGDRIGPRYGALLTTEELTQSAAFMRSDAMRAVWDSMIESYIANGNLSTSNLDLNSLTSPEVMAFLQSPAGLAFTREQDNISRILNEEFNAATIRMMPRLQYLVLNGMCEALAQDCPRHVREMLETR